MKQCFLTSRFFALAVIVATGTTGQATSPPPDAFADDPFGEDEAAPAARPIAPLPVVASDRPGLVKPDAAKSPADKSAKRPELKGLQGQLEFKEFSRSPAGVLNALSAAAEAKPDKEPTKSVSILQEYIVRGDWPALTKTLADQPADAGAYLYRQIVGGLVARKSQVTLLPDDVLALADASPKQLEASECGMLGDLAEQAVKRVRGPEQLLARLKTGTRWLGGEEPVKRLAAARFLLGAEMYSDAATYLPPITQMSRSNDPELLNLCADYLMRVAAKQENQVSMALAWELTQRVLSLPDAPAGEYTDAIRRSLKLLPSLGDRASDWIHGQLESDTRGLRALSMVASQSGPTSGDTNSRLQSLGALKQFGDQLVALLQEKPDKSKLPLTMLTLLWVAEAELNAGSPQEQVRSGGQRIETVYRGGQVIHRVIEEERIIVSPSQRDRGQPLPTAQLLALAPSEPWCETIDSELAQRVLRLKGSLAAASVDTEATLKFARELAKKRDPAGAALIPVLLTSWANANPIQEESNSNSWRFSHRSMSSSSGIPLTRARQVRRLRMLVDLLAQIRAADLKADYDEALVDAFASSHSQAEVYRRDDLEQVFGKIDDLGAGQAAMLANQMRGKLGSLWQRMDVQTQNNTNRTPEDLTNEVRRGYELAVELLTHALEDHPENVDLHLCMAQTTFDQAEFLYGQKIDLKTYTEMRDKAFAEFAEAATIFGGKPFTASPGRQRVDVYGRWFSAAMGASELSSLTASDKPDHDQIEHISAAIHSLKSSAKEAHLQAFAETLIQSSRQMQPQIKPWCYREALRILKDHAAGEPLRKALQLYDELLTEIELGVQVDGPAEIGSDRPFGVHVSVRATRSLHRESNNFAQLLYSGSSSQGATNEAKDKLKSMVKEQLGERFEIDGIQFHEMTTVPRPYGRDGWLEKPLAYLVLRAKNPAVDRIAPLKVDLEFADGTGSVLLPITSPPVLVSAAKAAPLPSVAKVKLKQTFDDRLAGEDQWRLEVKATATGLLANLDQVLTLPTGSTGGFTVKKIEPGALTVTGFDLTGKQVRPVSQRSWTILLTPPVAPEASQFAFPKAAMDGSEIKLEHYQDFDVVDAPAVLAARGRAMPFWSRWGGAIGAGGAAVAIIALAAVLMIKRRKPAADAPPAYRRPESLTPFSLLVLLRRIMDDANLSLSETERATLGDTIAQLEGRYFARQAHANGDIHLANTLDHWLARATSNGATRNGSEHAQVTNM